MPWQGPLRTEAMSPLTPKRQPWAAPTSAPVAVPDTVPVLGVPLALIDYEETMDWLDAMVAARDRGYVCVAAVHTVMVCQEDLQLRRAVLGSSLTVPDGHIFVPGPTALSLFRHRSFVVGLAVGLSFFSVLAPFLVLLAEYLQSGLDLTPRAAGLRFPPIS